MKRTIPILAFAVATFSAAVSAPAQDASPLFRAILVPPTGTTKQDEAISRWQVRIQKLGATRTNLENLGWAFIAKARATQDAGYYPLARICADELEQKHGESPESLLLRGHVLQNMHAFAAAEEVARRLVKLRGIAVDHGLLSDALMEQGKLKEAVAECQRFIDLRPGLDSYARAAHLRWLTGDIDGAASMMALAVESGSPLNGETYSWALVHLARYQLQLDHLPVALAASERALEVTPGYAPALLARGQVLLALDRPADAVAPLRKAADEVELPNYQWWLAEALRASGTPERAQMVETLLLEHGAESDPRTTALFLATQGLEKDAALSLARHELTVRQDPLTHDALAWALYADGAIAEAEAASAQALQEGTRDARILLHAGIIASLAGKPVKANQCLQAAHTMSATLTPSERTLLTTAMSSQQSRSEIPST